MVGAGETGRLNGLVRDNVGLLGGGTSEATFDGELVGVVGAGTETLAVLTLSDVYGAGVRLTVGVNLNVSVVGFGMDRARR